MPAFDGAMLFLGATTCFAAFVNGAIGYGFSSLTVPLALVFYTNRILDPAIVIIEVFVNVYVLVINLKGAGGLETSVSHLAWALARHCARGLCVGPTAAGVDQIRHVHDHFAPDPVASRGLAPPYRSKLADRSAIRVDAGHPLFGDNYLRPAFGHAV
ncbi:hypothetical protein [Bradyrhizobium sp. CCBAU 53421]|uniref:hypothetical protein n=1 Tax=Bradyrhizobium sp. CCBAU 53421 TaxID=1325120 RepID=UPI001FEE2198|nr:hypothetical protein [Bradyrhizobium sp. CCBAU 53421]